MSLTHKAQYRVYYEDTDAVGIMYHANFINFCERGRSELLREVGYPASEVQEKLNIGFVVRHIDCDYLKMAKLDDLIEVQTVLQSMKNTSFVMEQTLYCQNSVVFKMDITLVCMDLSGKPTRVPDKLRQAFKEYIKEEE